MKKTPPTRGTLTGKASPLRLGRSKVGDLQVITIPLTDYASLLDAQKRLLALTVRKFPRSPIDRDPILASFIRDRIGRMELTQIISDCVSEFGKSPSRSAISRFSMRIRAK